MANMLDAQSANSILLATFYVGEALCALDAAGVQEVIRVGRLTPVRHAPEEVAGIVNLRGKIVTVLDIGLKLGLSRTVTDRDSRIFIIEDRNEWIGLLVNHVGEVVEVEGEEMQPLPANVPTAQSRYFRGVWRAGGRVISFLDVGQVLSGTTQ